MKKILLSIAAAASVAAAVPAMAQSWDRGHGYEGGPTYDRGDAYGRGGYDRGAGYGDINQRIREITFRIERGTRDGSLDWRESRMLRGQLAGVQNLERRYGWDGLDGRERADLNARLDRLSYQVRGQRHDRDYGSGYGDDRGGYGDYRGPR